MFKTEEHGGITLTSSGETIITLKWYKEGPPSFADLDIKLRGEITVGIHIKPINVS